MADGKQTGKSKQASADRDEFYVGYLPEAPPALAQRTKSVILGLFALVAVVAVALATSQRPAAVSFFEFGAPRTFEGVVDLEPYPMLRVDRPGARVPSRYYVVALFKHGADEQLAPFAGQRVRLEGTLIHRDDQTMLELVDGTVEAIDAGPQQVSNRRVLDTVTLRGEIVDSKCHLGVMKPGERKPHRACAELCIRGGIPPIFLLTDDNDLPVRHLMLVGNDGRALNAEVLDFIAEPLEITGRVERLDDLWVLAAEPDTFERL